MPTRVFFFDYIEGIMAYGKNRICPLRMFLRY